MLCEFVDGPENGQQDEVADGCDEVYCTGLSREWWIGTSVIVGIRSDSSSRPNQYQRISKRTEAARKLKEIEAAFNRKPEDMLTWAR